MKPATVIYYNALVLCLSVSCAVFVSVCLFVYVCLSLSLLPPSLYFKIMK